MKDPITTWIEAARHALINEGISGVKIDLLAKTLRVTRGGFYHNFRDRQDLLDQLLRDWQRNCRFLPRESPGGSPSDAIAWLDRMIERLIEEDGYDHEYDMAMREWARADRRVARAVQRADNERMETLRHLFLALGCPEEEARIRARVFYYHQIGYYAIGVRESAVERRRNVQHYLNILGGREQIQAARNGCMSAPDEGTEARVQTARVDVEYAP